MITSDIKDKLRKIYELVKGGATEGEKQAAQNALDRIIEKYNLEGVDLEAIDLERYQLKYSTDMEVDLIFRLIRTLFDHSIYHFQRSWGGVREVELELTYVEFVTISTAYEYFRRHMKAQWKLFCAPNLKRCKTVKSRNKRRKELQGVFFLKYAIASNLYRPDELTTVEWDSLPKKEQQDRIRLQKVEGGKFNRQMTSGKLLNA